MTTALEKLADLIRHVHTLRLEQTRARRLKERRIVLLRALLRLMYGRSSPAEVHAALGPIDIQQEMENATEGHEVAPFDPRAGWPVHWLDSQRPAAPPGTIPIDDTGEPVIPEMSAALVRLSLPELDVWVAQKTYEAHVAKHLVMQECVTKAAELDRVAHRIQVLLIHGCAGVATPVALQVLECPTQQGLEDLRALELGYALGDCSVSRPHVIDAQEDSAS